MDIQNTLIIILSLALVFIVVWYMLTHKTQPRRQMSLEAQRAYEGKKGEILAEQNYHEIQRRQQQFLQKKKEIARRLNRRNGSLF